MNIHNLIVELKIVSVVAVFVEKQRSRYNNYYKLFKGNFEIKNNIYRMG